MCTFGVLLHLMFSFTYSGEPLRQSCVFLLVLRLAACFHGDFRVLATWRGDSALSSGNFKKLLASGISSELRAHQMARMSEVPGRPRTQNPRRSLTKFWTLQNFTIPLEPTCRFCRAGCSESASGNLVYFFLLLVLGIGIVVRV